MTDALRRLDRTTPLVAYRVADGRFPLLDGGGAARYGGRWNAPGHHLVYAARSFAGALLEILVHANVGRIPRHHVAIELSVPVDVAVEMVDVTVAPGWDAADLLVSRRIGDAWRAGLTSAVLVVPSVVAPPHEQNVLLNPAHPDFTRITVTAPEPVRWDARLFAQNRSVSPTAPSSGQPAKRRRSR